MGKTWLVAFEEIRRNAFKKSFILVLFSVPFFIVVMVVPGIIMERLSQNDLPVGYVDLSGILDQARPLPLRDSSRNFDILSFSDRNSALSALDGEQIQAFFVLQPDYSDSRQAELVYREKPDGEATGAFYDFLQLNLLAQLPEQVAWRAADRTSVTIQDPEGVRRLQPAHPH